ncbi:MAG: DUF6106 family protein [Clostridiales bacterium]|jgi:hypothetical protein|nr:DUF6106 family protein [Clostridiales bacterium]
MEDVFYEQLVKKNKDKRDFLITIGLYALALILMALCLFFLKAVGILLIFFIYLGAYQLNARRKIEYEYIFTNGELDIDCIYNKSKRKRMCTVALSEVEIMAHIDDKNNMGQFSTVQETKDYSSGLVNKNTYCLLASNNGKKTKFIIEPNEVLLKAFSRYLTPRKLFIKK